MKKKEISGRRKTRGFVPDVMVAPYLIMFIVFTVIPILAAIVLSFTYFDMVQMPKFTGFTNYIRMFLEDDIFVKALVNTLLLSRWMNGKTGIIIAMWNIHAIKEILGAEPRC